MYNLDWSRKELTRQKLGTFGEYYAKMTLASYGLSIYTSEVDDHGIDFVAETKKGFLKFQVKTIRQGTSYAYAPEEHFNIYDSSLYFVLVVCNDGEHPLLYLFPATIWQETDSGVFVYRSYENKKSKPEYGLNYSRKNMAQLDKFRLENMIEVIT